MVGLLCGVGSSGCCGRGVGSSARGLPFKANMLLLVLEELLGTDRPGSVGFLASLNVLVRLLVLRWVVVGVPQS